VSAPGGRTLPAFDVYAELGLGRDATPNQVKDAYRRQAKAHHPDVASDASVAEARMKRINQARDVLLDPVRRAEYDRQRAAPGAPGAGPAPRRSAPGAAPSGAADTAAAQAERDRRARAERAGAEQERRARAKAEQDRWERAAEARAARDVADRAKRRRGERVTAARSEPRREPETASRAKPRPGRGTAAEGAPQRQGARVDARGPAGPAPRAWTDFRSWLGSHVTVEIRVGDANLRWTLGRGKNGA